MADGLALSAASIPSTLGVPTRRKQSPKARLAARSPRTGDEKTFWDAALSAGRLRVHQRASHPACAAFRARLLGAVTAHLLRQAQVEAETHADLRKNFEAIQAQKTSLLEQLTKQGASPPRGKASRGLPGK